MVEEKIKNIITVPNQKIITVKHSICDKEHLYTQYNIKANKMALKELSPNAYKLYMYFDLNQNNYTFALSCKDICEHTGMSDKTYQKSVNELIEKGYLVQSEIKNQYIFYDGKENGEYSKVETTLRKGKDSSTDYDKVHYDTDKNYFECPEEITGEILQYNTKNNTNNINDAPDTNGAITATPKIADALEKAERELFQFNSDKMKDKDIQGCIYGAIMLYLEDNLELEEIRDKIIEEFSDVKGWYGCDRDKVTDYVNHIFA